MNHNIPADLSPEAAAWLQAQMAIQNARTAAVLREEITKVDDWANGIFVALRDALGNLLGDASPLIGDALARAWGPAALDYDRLKRGQAATLHPGESLEELEARALLHRFYGRLGLMPKAGVRRCHIPDDCIDEKRYPLFMARTVMRELIKSLQPIPGATPC